MNRDMICISCPVGCRLKVSGSLEALRVEGNRCARGEIYAREEVAAPKRVVTATVALSGAAGISRLPVKTTAPLPKEHIAALLNHLYTLQLASPVKLGDTVLRDVAGTGIDVVAARSL